MSATTALALEQALEAHIADEGDMCGAYVIIAESTTLDDLDEDRSEATIIARHGQSVFTTNGLIWAALDA